MSDISEADSSVEPQKEEPQKPTPKRAYGSAILHPHLVGLEHCVTRLRELAKLPNFSLHAHDWTLRAAIEADYEWQVAVARAQVLEQARTAAFAACNKLLRHRKRSNAAGRKVNRVSPEEALTMIEAIEGQKTPTPETEAVRA